MIYMAYLKQKLDGCDYTIECGAKLITLSSTTLPAAEVELKALILEQYRAGRDDELASALLLEVAADLQMPLSEWYADATAATEQERQSAELAGKRALYEQLKRELGEQ